MTLNLKLALIAITLIYIILILKRIVKKEIQASQCTFWLVSGILLIIASAVPNLIEVLTKILGFEVPANMLFCITIFVAFYLIFNLTIKGSKIYQDNVTLTQEISIMKYEMKKMKEERKDKDDGEN